jgi:hypothetical protein
MLSKLLAIYTWWLYIYKLDYMAPRRRYDSEVEMGEANVDILIYGEDAAIS